MSLLDELNAIPDTPEELVKRTQDKAASGVSLLDELNAMPSADGTVPMDDDSRSTRAVTGQDPGFLAKVITGQVTAADYQEFLNNTNDRVQAFAQGSSFGLSDDLAAIAENAYLLTDQSNALGEDTRTMGQRWEDFWDTSDFAENREGLKEQRDQFARENPGEALLYELAGGLMVPGLGGMKTVSNVARNGTIAQKLATGAGVGAVEGAVYGYGVADSMDSSASPVLQSMLKYAAMGAAGGTMGAGVFAGAPLMMKSLKNLTSQGRTMRDAHALADKVQLRVSVLLEDAMQSGQILTTGQAKARVAAHIGETVQTVDDAFAVTGRKAESMLPGTARKHLELQQELRQADALAQEALKGPIGKAVTRVGRAGTKMGGVLDQFMGVLSTRLTEANESIGAGLTRHDFNVSKRTQDALERVEAFTVGWYKKGVLGKNNPYTAEVDRMLFNGDYEGARVIVMEHGTEAQLAAFDEIQPLLAELGADLNSVGAGINPKTLGGNYFPRRIRNYDEFRLNLGKEEVASLYTHEKAFAAKHKTTRDQMTERQRQRAANEWMRKKPNGGSPGNRNLKGRSIDQVSEEMMPQYTSGSESLINYIKRSIEDVEEHRFLGSQIKKGAGSEIDLGESVGGFMDRAVASGRLDETKAQTDVIRSLLTTRFGAAKRPMNEFVSALKNIGLMTALANPKSAAIQIADVGVSGFQNNLINTAQGMIQGMTRGGAKLEHVGLKDVISAEMHNVGATSKALKSLLEVSQFSRIDRWGKQTFINSAVNKAQQQLKKAAANGDGSSEFHKKWHTLFDDPDSMEDLKRAVMNKDFDNENLQLMMFSELAEAQPISLSQMPQKYLDHPGGRIAYTLKSFALKQLDLMRKRVWNEYQKGNTAQASKNAAAYALIVGGSNTMTDEMRDWVFSGGVDEIDLSPEHLSNETLYNVLAATTFANKYNTQKFFNNGRITDPILNAITPPLGMTGALISDIVTGLPDSNHPFLDSESAQAFPVLGKIVHDAYGSGIQELRIKQQQESGSSRRGRNRSSGRGDRSRNR